MPVYEFYCPDCHTIFSFFSRRVDTRTRPDCPRCGRHELDRQVSLFAISKGRGDGEGQDGPDLPAGLDEERMMQALASMSGELEGLSEDNPKDAARMMKRLFEASGMRMGDGMAEAIQRLEAGEDPEQVEAEMGDVFEQEDPFAAGGAGRRSGLASSLAQLGRGLRRERLPPARDDGWYPLKPQ